MITPTLILDEMPLAPEIKQALPAMVSQARESGQALTLYFHGRRGSGRRRTAEALAGELGITLLALDLARAPVSTPDFEPALQLLFRQAWLQDALVYGEGLETLQDNDRNPQAYQSLLAAVAEAGGVTILAGTQPWIPPGQGLTGVITVDFPTPDADLRRDCWRSKLLSEDIIFEPREVDALSDRFRLYSEQISDAIATGRNYARWRTAAQTAEDLPGEVQPTLSDLFTAARAQSGHDLAALARKIEPIYTWDNIVLPADALAQMREICQQVEHRDQVLTKWGFGRKLSLGKGVNALFAGPTGTGKTMAAEIIVKELGLDLYKIDLSGVISKYIGETEKNLSRIFLAAENANAILFFDEADALFGKRSEVRDSHDRYANIEIAYLLQKMEQYDGIAILVTNLRQNMDDAFVRRLQFIVEFPFPDEANRDKIWRIHFPCETPRAPDIDYAFLARQFRIAGGNIKDSGPVELYFKSNHRL